jgi:ketosteroid isomerase-like protein
MTYHGHPNVTVVREGIAAVQRGDTAWMDQHLADDVVWPVDGNSKWAGPTRQAEGAGVLRVMVAEQEADLPSSLVQHQQ